MASAFPIGELAVSTLRNRSGELADNVTKNNVLLQALSAKDRINTADGGREIFQELEYAENGTVGWYSNYDVLNTTPQVVFDTSAWDWKQLAGTVSISGFEKMVNSGKEKVINWLNARINNLDKSMRNQVALALFSDGTVANQLGGLKLLVADDPTLSSVVGGINQQTQTWWRNKVKNIGAPATAINIQAAMNQLWIQQVRGTDKPDLIVGDSVMYTAFEGSMQQIQRFVDKQTRATLGFEELAYKTARFVYDENCPLNRAYFLNTDYIFLRPHEKRQFVPLENRNSFNQDAELIPVVWMGNLTCSNRKLQGVLTGT